MSLETLYQAARYVEMQEQKQKQASPSKQITNFAPSPPPTPVTTTATIKLVVEPAVTTTPTPRTIHVHPAHRVIRNSFDIINPLIIDEAGEAKRKQPPMVFRSGTREVHNKLEKHRRAHLKECFDSLKKQLPFTSDEKKTSNLNILDSAINYIQWLKKQERELEHQMEKLAREKIIHQQKLIVLKKEVSHGCEIDISEFGFLEANSSSPFQSSIVKEEVVEETIQNIKSEDVLQIPTTNELKVTKSITKALPVVTTTFNGVKEGILPQSTQVQTTALSVLPIGYPVNQGLVLQKVIVPKGITDLSQLVSPPVAHFITTPQQIGGKVVPLVNAQYVVKPLVVVSTPSRPS